MKKILSLLNIAALVAVIFSHTALAYTWTQETDPSLFDNYIVVDAISNSQTSDLHLLALNPDGNSSNKIYYRKYDGSWNAWVNISTNATAGGKTIQNPQIRLDYQGDPVIGWIRNDGNDNPAAGTDEICFVFSDEGEAGAGGSAAWDGGNTAQCNTSDITDIVGGNTMDFAINSNNKVTMGFIDKVAVGDFEAHVSRSTGGNDGGSWSDTVIVEDATEYETLQLINDTDDDVHMLFLLDQDSQVIDQFHMDDTTFTSSWIETSNIDNQVSSSYEIETTAVVMGVNYNPSNDNVYLVYWNKRSNSDAKLIAAVSTDRGSWSFNDLTTASEDNILETTGQSLPIRKSSIGYIGSEMALSFYTESASGDVDLRFIKDDISGAVSTDDTVKADMSGANTIDALAVKPAATLATQTGAEIINGYQHSTGTIDNSHFTIQTGGGVPEFSTYVYTATILMAFGLLYKRDPEQFAWIKAKI